MVRFLSSLTFLYGWVIAILLVYGFLYYKDFTRSLYQRKRFPVAFLLIAVACFAFLWINFNAPLKLRTFSNLDHHFIRLNGFEGNGSIELGRTDTVHVPTNTYNRFSFRKESSQLKVISSYSEEPFYVNGEKGYHLLSANYPAQGHGISFLIGKVPVKIQSPSPGRFELVVDGKSFARDMTLKKGSSAWNLFREQDEFINSIHYNDERLFNALRNIYLLRDDVSRKEGGELKFFLSGRVLRYAHDINYEGKRISSKELAFESALPDNASIAWGIGFLDNNRNQYRIIAKGQDSLLVKYRYPISFPLAEEDREDWTEHAVSKFLVCDGKDLQGMPAVFKEGFLFPSMSDQPSTNFAPILLNYRKTAQRDSFHLTAGWLDGSMKKITMRNSELVLPAAQPGLGWSFSIVDSYEWDFAGRTFTASTWQALIWSCLGLFFGLVFLTAVYKPANRQSWVWQLLASITIVLLTTRFFLYWRYKSFPPFEGMDLPSEQQLQSIGNFAIILGVTVILALIFGFGFIQLFITGSRRQTARWMNRPYSHIGQESMHVAGNITDTFSRKIPILQRMGGKGLFFLCWIGLLFAGGVIAALNHFDPGICRHMAIGFILLYFGFLYISYKHSPLVISSDRSWWSLGTRNTLDVIVSNPVKILLSVSLLALFVFIDIGFAIVFLNFLLFNEAFLCSNYAIAGLSTGSRRNTGLFGLLGLAYLLFFVLNLLFAPYIFKFLLELPQLLYLVGYIAFAISISYVIMRLMVQWKRKQKLLAGLFTAVSFFLIAFFFFPKDRILEKAAMTKYRIDVLTTPVDKAIAGAYEEGSTYEPVIRAAQNQWFINTFIYEENNPAVGSAGFTLLPHAPQNKGAKYNAQATDLVASRFLIAEHGKWSVLLYVLLLLLPSTLLASFYKLYPDFTNRINGSYPSITAGFSILNYLVITALLVILAATGRYIFFGQDLPFGSILSKQSLLFPCILLLLTVFFFRRIPLEHYANRRKLIPGAILFTLLAALLFLVKPVFNCNKEFAVANLSKDLDEYVQLHLQPVLDYIDTSARTRRLSISAKDQLFSDSLKKLIDAGLFANDSKFFVQELGGYARGGFARHLDQRRLLYLDLHAGSPQLAVNDNYFRVDPPPHLQQLWKGNVYADTTTYNVSLWNASDGSLKRERMSGYTDAPQRAIIPGLELRFSHSTGDFLYEDLYLVNQSAGDLLLQLNGQETNFPVGDSLRLSNPARMKLLNGASKHEMLLTVEPDAYMKNYYVNGSRYYSYPMGSRFIWARNFAESISSEYLAGGQRDRNAFLSTDYGLMDSLTRKIQSMMTSDTAYQHGSEYGICVADGNGRILAMADFIKGLQRPNPNDKAAFSQVVTGDGGAVSQTLLRKQIGNINLLRLNPGPGSTLKPIVFSAIASQLNLDWDQFSSTGFTEKLKYYGGARVPEYDFEKNNGVINTVNDYLKVSDNYYHSNVLLLGSYPKQDLHALLTKSFSTEPGSSESKWPYFNYEGQRYSLQSFDRWPAFFEGKADFGTDSSFTSIGLLSNYGIYTHRVDKSFDMFATSYDSLLFLDAYRKSGFILPETGLFDQHGDGVNHRNAYDLFTSCFRGHVKGSSQVMIPPIKMVEAFGRMVSQNRSYELTLDPYASSTGFSPFYVDNRIIYNNYLSLVRENVMKGMQDALFRGTAGRLGSMLKDGAPYFYYGKTGTTGDDEVKRKSKLFTLIISEKDLTDPDFNFRKNKFITIYFTSQNGPAKQNEEFQAAIVEYLQHSGVFKKYMNGVK